MGPRSKYWLAFLLLLLVDVCRAQNLSATLTCSTSADCGIPNGLCVSNTCVCQRGWLIRDISGCTYQQKSKLTAFLLSFFVGAFGVDWFYLSVGSGAYIVAGIIKLITFGGFGVWWLVDWIRLLANAFQDGNGLPLLDWNN